MSISLVLYIDELDVEDEGRAGRYDGPDPLVPVGLVGGYDQGPPLPYTHTLQASVPTSDHLTIHSKYS